MHELVVVEHLSLDGVMQGPARADEDPRDGFAHGGWAGPLVAADPDAARLYGRGFEGLAAFLFGRRTYADLVGHWLAPATGPNPFADSLAATPKHVCTRDPDAPLPHPASHRLLGDAATTVRELKASGDGALVLMGSGVLHRALAAAGLVDRYVLTALPVVLGRGLRLFDDVAPTDLEVEWLEATPAGATVGSFRVRSAR